MAAAIGASTIASRAERRAASKTFEEVARQWHAHWKADRDERHAHYVLKRLEAGVFPEIGSLPLGEIPTSAFRDAVQKIEQRGAVDIAKRVVQTMQAWADYMDQRRAEEADQERQQEAA